MEPLDEQTIRDIQARLKGAYDRDQEIRTRTHSFSEEEREECLIIDTENTTMIKGIIAQYGFPTISQFGEEASHQAWLLVQHADRDRPFQKEVLALIYPLVAQDEIQKADYAYLYDRVAVGMKQPQHYGTQGYVDDDGKWYPDPIQGLGDPKRLINSRKDLAVLNARREQMGIGPFEPYFESMNNLVSAAEPRPSPARG